MIDNRENLNCFESVCEYTDSRGIVRQRYWIELSMESQSENEHATSIDELSGWYLLVRVMITLVQFCCEHTCSISCLKHWICSSSHSFPQYSYWMKSLV